MNKKLQLTPLAYAAYHDNIRGSEILLDQGMDVNEGSPSALWSAVNGRASHAMVEMLINKGANVNTSYPLRRGLTWKDQDVTAVYMAIQKKRPVTVRLLLLRGALPTKDERCNLCGEKQTFLKMVECMEQVLLAREACLQPQHSDSQWKICHHLTAAFLADFKCFSDYLATTIRDINSGTYYGPEDISYLRKMLDTFVMMTNMPQGHQEAFKYFQEHVLPEIEGYDAANNGLLFASNNEKHTWFTQMSENSSWIETVSKMNENNKQGESSPKRKRTKKK